MEPDGRGGATSALFRRLVNGAAVSMFSTSAFRFLDLGAETAAGSSSTSICSASNPPFPFPLPFPFDLPFTPFLFAVFGFVEPPFLGLGEAKPIAAVASGKGADVMSGKLGAAVASSKLGARGGLDLGATTGLSGAKPPGTSSGEGEGLGEPNPGGTTNVESLGAGEGLGEPKPGGTTGDTMSEGKGDGEEIGECMTDPTENAAGVE